VQHVTVHLWRVPRSAVPRALLRMGVDRVRLRGTPGLSFAKLLGTGDGSTFGPRDADVRTWGLLAVWADEASALAFEAHPTPRGWRRIAETEWRADLGCLRTRGEWAGRTPFAPRPDLQGWDGPVASITRARLRPSLAATFWRAVPPVVDDLDAGAGPTLRVGIGEAPVGLQGTLTLWPSAAALQAFAYRRGPHRRAIADTAALGWYAEELFARFAVLGQRGTVGGLTTEEPGGA
jgi:hypothetical protein